MATTPKVLGFAGSLRKDSLNKKLVKVALDGARAAGAEVTYIDLADYPLPFFDEDLEKRDGLPANARKLKELFKSHQGLLIATPEYNKSIPGVLKNAIDWVSRPVPDEKPFEPFAGKVAGIMSASPGAFGGIRGLGQLGYILSNISIIVLPDGFALVKADGAFAPDGSMTDAKSAETVRGIGRKVVETVKKHHG